MPREALLILFHWSFLEQELEFPLGTRQNEGMQHPQNEEILTWYGEVLVGKGMNHLCS